MTASIAEFAPALAPAHARLASARAPRAALRLASACTAVLLSGCVQASQIYPLVPHAKRAPEAETSLQGSVQIERIEGGARLFALRLLDLPPPEAWGTGCTHFAVWVEDLCGRTVKVGALSYDRARRSGSLLGSARDVEFLAFTVKVTAERDESATAPSRLLLAERHVTNH